MNNREKTSLFAAGISWLTTVSVLSLMMGEVGIGYGFGAGIPVGMLAYLAIYFTWK